MEAKKEFEEGATLDVRGSTFLETKVDKECAQGEFIIDIDTPIGFPLPIAFSMPFCKGQLWDIDEIRLIEGEREVPAQYKILNRWPDGSLKWVQGITKVTKEFKVLYNQGKSKNISQDPVVISSDRENVTLKTGDNVLTINLESCEAIFSKGDNSLNFILSRLVDREGNIFFSRKADLYILEEGPLRGTIRLQGYHVDHRGKEFMRFDAFISLYSGAPIVEITHALGVDSAKHVSNEDTDLLSISSLDIPLRLGGDLKVIDNYGISVEGNRYSIPENGHLFQWEDYQFELLNEECYVKEVGTRSQGVLALDTEEGGIFVVVPDFWQQYPKGFSIQEDGVDIELFPKLDKVEKGRYANRENEHIWYYYLRDDVYTMRQGVEKSHKVYIGFNTKPSSVDKVMPSLTDVSVGLPDPQYLAQTKAAGNIVPISVSQNQWDVVIKSGFDAYLEKQKKKRWYGLLNWGDWHGERGYNWGNLEYDDAACFFMQALRTQDATYFRQALHCARHYIDVDTVSFHQKRDLIGQVWIHSLGHTGGYYAPGTLDIFNYDMSSDAFHIGRGASLGHTRTEGVFLMYLLTGDIRALEHGKKIADHLMTRPMLKTEDFNYTTAREPGWAMVAFSAAYRSTGQQIYLDAAEKVANLVLHKAEGKGVWHRPLEARNCAYVKYKEHPHCHGELAFTTAFQAIGMIQVYEITGREDIRENIITTAYYIIEKLYSPEAKGFYHSPCPLRTETSNFKSSAPQVGGLVGCNIWYLLAFAYKETGDEQFKEIILDTWQKTLNDNIWFNAKSDDISPASLTGVSIFMPRIQALLHNILDKE